MDDYRKVMEFTFSSMQADGIGMVHGIDFFPWVDNPQFQVAPGLSNIVQDFSKDTTVEGEPEKCTSVSSEIKKMNLSANGEYVATMNQVIRKNIDMLYNMQQCRGVLYSWPKEYDCKILLNTRSAGGFIDNENGDESVMTVGTVSFKQYLCVAINMFGSAFNLPKTIRENDK